MLVHMPGGTLSPVRRVFWGFWNGRVRPWLDRMPPHIKISADLMWLTHLWEQRFPGVPPVGHRIRGLERWVRFHSLPESKRYADNEAEYEELLGRHHALLRELAAPDSELIAITASWSPTAHARVRSRALKRAAPNAALWQSYVDPDDVEAGATNLFVSRIQNTPDVLDPLLRLVADFGTADVILTTRDLCWLYHPYDGGADVIAASQSVRDELAHRYADWLPTNASGL